MLTKDRKIEIFQWETIRPSLQKVNKNLCNIIDNIGPSKQHRLFKATYRFGDLIVKNGIAQIPSKTGRLVPMCSDEVDPAIRENLSYSQIPLFLTIKNGTEVFLDNDSRIVPLNFFNPGSLLGLFETIDAMCFRESNAKWSVSAGSRSVFMLPKLSDTNELKKLRQYFELPATTSLKNMSDQWDVFRHIIDHPKFSQDWTCEVLFFPKNWILDQIKPTQWEKFKSLLFHEAWIQSQFSLGKVEQDLIWETFAETISLKNAKPRSYLADQVKHVISLITGKSPGFRPVTHPSIAIPLKGLQQVFINIYNLKNYLPTFMYVCPLNTIKQNQQIYYSLNYQISLEQSPISKSSKTIMYDLRDIKQLLDTMKSFAAHSHCFNHDILKDIHIDYFHTEEDNFGEILPSKTIPNNDQSLLIDQKIYPNREFCPTSLFWRGCLRIQKEK